MKTKRKLLSVAIMLLAVFSVEASTFTVTNTSSSTLLPGSLGRCFRAAQSNGASTLDTILFDLPLPNTIEYIDVTRGYLPITNLVIIGPSSQDLTIKFNHVNTTVLPAVPFVTYTDPLTTTSLEMSNLIFSGNSVPHLFIVKSGDGVLSSAKVKNCVFKNIYHTTAFNNSSGGNELSLFNGSFFGSNPLPVSLSFDNCIFRDIRGGNDLIGPIRDLEIINSEISICQMEDALGEFQSFRLKNSLIRNNSARYLVGIGSGDLSIENSTISDNSGCAIIIDLADVLIKDSEFKRNFSFTLGVYDCSGANGGVELNNCTFSSNTPRYLNSCITSVRSTLYLDRVNIMDTRAVSSTGGGMRISNSDALIQNSTISENRRLDNGGGINILSSEVDIVNSRISNNESVSGAGGGISIDSDSDSSIVRISNTTIDGNSAFNEGGGLFADYYGFNIVEILNSTISQNDAGTAGGGLYLKNATRGDLDHVTVYGNHAHSFAGGVYTGSANGMQMQNTILSGNTATDYGQDGVGTFVSNDGHNLIGNLGSIQLSGNTAGNIITNVPVVQPSLALNGVAIPTHALLFGSPAIDAGVSTSTNLTHDQRGFVRIGTPDIGAYESSSCPFLGLGDDIVVCEGSCVRLSACPSKRFTYEWYEAITRYDRFGNPIMVFSVLQNTQSQLCVSPSTTTQYSVKVYDNLTGNLLFSDIINVTMLPSSDRRCPELLEHASCCGGGGTGLSPKNVASELDQISTSKLEVALYPNPSQGEFNISIVSDLEEQAKLKIFDAIGKVVYQSQYTLSTGENNLVVDLINQHPGLYTVHLETKDQTITKRIVLVK